MECDLLAGERRPSYTEKGQIKNWKVLHIRFIEPSTARPDAPSKSGNSRLNPLKPSVMTASMPLNLMSKLGKLITPKLVLLLLHEEFSVKGLRWLEPL